MCVVCQDCITTSFSYAKWHAEIDSAMFHTRKDNTLHEDVGFTCHNTLHKYNFINNHVTVITHLNSCLCARLAYQSENMVDCSECIHLRKTNMSLLLQL